MTVHDLKVPYGTVPTELTVTEEISTTNSDLRTIILKRGAKFLLFWQNVIKNHTVITYWVYYHAERSRGNALGSPVYERDRGAAGHNESAAWRFNRQPGAGTDQRDPPLVPPQQVW